MRYLLSILLITITANATTINIIASNGCSFNSITYKSLKDLFMKKTKYYKYNYIEVLDNTNLYKRFIVKYLKKSPTKMHIYWTRMIFTGTKKPPKKVPDEKLIQVDTTGCKVSYTSFNYIEGWKVLNVTP